MKLRSTAIIALVALCACATGHASEKSNSSIDELIRQIEDGGTPQQLLVSADQRIGVFSFEDADGTGLGDVAASTFAREILITASASRIGVIFFPQGLAPEKGSNLSYFDKVDKLAEAQAIALALWGVLRKTADGVEFVTYVQVPAGQTADAFFSSRITLPRAMGGGSLTARLRPDRILVYRGTFSDDDVAQLRHAAEEMNTLRSAPNSTTVLSTLPPKTVSYVTNKSPDGSWVQMAAGGKQGWIPRRPCTGRCESFLLAANFTGHVLMYLADRRLPDIANRYGAEPAAVASQLKILDRFNTGTHKSLERARSEAEGWLADKNSVPPGGAAFANFRALIDIRLLLNEALAQATGSATPDAEAYALLKLDAEAVQKIAQELAVASQYDPRNPVVLQNLSVLFDYLGDTRRAALAAELAAQYSDGS